MKTLAIDTSASLCAAAVYDGGVELGRAVLDIGKGHAEHLMAVIEDALQDAKLPYPDLDLIVISIGPGSFTGVRVGVSVARGLALALKIPAVGVSTLEAVAAQVRAAHPGRAVLAAFTSGRGDIQAALYGASGEIIQDPAVIGLAEAVNLAAEHQAIIAGSAVPMMVEINSALTIAGTAVTSDIGCYARLGLTKPANGEKPKPLYLREPDAKPQAGFILPRVS